MYVHHNDTSGEIKVGDKVIGYSWGVSLRGAVAKEHGGSLPPGLDLNLTEVTEKIVAYLAEHVEGGTRSELIEALGLDDHRFSAGVALNALQANGDVIVAREKRTMQVEWAISSNVDFRTGSPLGHSMDQTIERTEYADVYRLSPQAWIEAVS